MFDSTKEDLIDLLKQIDAGSIQLPDFQRDWVWDDDGIRSLLASIIRGFPVGAILTLTNGGEVQFKARPLASVEITNKGPDEFLLDGQQRLTSLYQTLFSKKVVNTKTAKGQGIKRFYFLDIRRALSPDADYEDMIIGVPEDRIERSNFGRTIERDLSSPEKQYELHMFPLNQIFEEKDWIFGWRDYWRDKEDIYDMEKEFDRRLIDTVKRYEMPVIRLKKDNSREAVCLVFEKVNTGGKKLDAFELLTAMFAADQYNLREDWLGVSGNPGRFARLRGEAGRQDVYKELKSTDFLQTCTLLHTMDLREAAAATGLEGRELPAISIKRDALLRLPLPAYQKYADKVEEAFKEAGAFVNEQKIIWHKDVPYPPQLIALAGVFARMGTQAQTAQAKQKLSEWFWCGVLGERYGVSTETRIARDVPAMIAWLKGEGPPPSTVDEALFQADRLDTLRSRQAAAYKGLHALLMREGCRDFISGKPVDIMTFFQSSMDIHHIFPRAWCEKNGIPPAVYNSIINKTALSAKSNRKIGGNAPSEYLKKIEEDGIASTELDEILKSHLIDPEHLRADDFDAFWNARRKALSNLVSSAMNKKVVDDHGDNEPVVDLFDDEEQQEAAA